MQIYVDIFVRVEHVLLSYYILTDENNEQFHINICLMTTLAHALNKKNKKFSS